MEVGDIWLLLIISGGLEMTHFWSQMKRATATLTLCFVSIAQLVAMAPDSAYAISDTLVISEVQYGGAGVGVSSLEFVELYNKSGAPIDLSATGLKLHIRTSTGTDANKTLTFVHSSVPSHGHFLLVNAAASASLLSLADATYSSSGNTLVDNGAVYISNSSTNDVTTAIDLVGWNDQPAPGYEGSPITGLSAGQSIERKHGGINGNTVDTDNNSADFIVRNAPTPENSLSNTQPSAPAAPTLNSALAGDQEVVLKWSAIEGAQDYRVYVNGNPLASLVSATTFTVTGLTNGASYDFRVSARNMFGTEGALSNTRSATPEAAIVVNPSPVSAQIVYKKDGVAGSMFGVGTITAEVTVPVGELGSSDNPTITFTRPNTSPVVKSLTYNAGLTAWTATYSIDQGTVNQDGQVGVALATTTGKSFALSSGGNLQVNTTVGDPKVTVFSRCSTNQDSFRGETDSDVSQVYIYKSASADLPNLIAVASVTNGSFEEVFIGDNIFGELYVVAVDLFGNKSQPVKVTNDITPPADPAPQVEAKDRMLAISWSAAEGADSYILRWKHAGDPVYQEKTTKSLSEDITVDNDQQYEVSLAVQDAACNKSNFTIRRATARPSGVISQLGRGGVADYESKILAEAVMVAETKDGEATTPVKVSPYSLEEDRNQNGILDREEGLQSSPSPQPTQSPSTSTGPDRSRLIVTIAILLIIAGTAIAAYSWYQGDTTTPSELKPIPPADETEQSEEKTETQEASPTAEKKSTGRKGKGRRKTRW